MKPKFKSVSILIDNNNQIYSLINDFLNFLNNNSFELEKLGLKINIIFDSFNYKTSHDSHDSHDFDFSAIENSKIIKDILEVKDICEKNKLNFYYFTPPIAYDNNFKKFSGIISILLKEGQKNYFISNFGFITLLEEMLKLDKTNNDLNLIFSHNFNLANSMHIEVLKDSLNKRFSISEVILSPELTLNELDDLSRNFYFKHDDKYSDKNNLNRYQTILSVYAYGYFPIITARVKYPNWDNYKADKKFIKDQKGYMFPLEKDYLGNTIILNSKKLNLIFDLDKLIKVNINGFFIDTRFLELKEIKFIIENIINLLVLLIKLEQNNLKGLKVKKFREEFEDIIKEISKSNYLKDFTKGHLYREVI
jgi:collagenase-like PrtC family protease